LITDALTPTPVGISIRHKVSKRASVRNRIKGIFGRLFRYCAPFITSLAAGNSAVGSTEECDYQQFLQKLKLLAKARNLPMGIRVYYEGGPHILRI